MLTTIQDRGRWGFQARGVPVAGPMDPVSHRLANALVGNVRERGGARGHAARPGARVRGRAAGRRRRRRVRDDARRTRRCRATRRSSSRPDRACASARAARGARAYLAISGGIAVAAGARQPVDAPGQRDGRRRRPCARGRRSSAARRSAPRRRDAAGAAGGRRSRCPIATRASACCPGPQRDHFTDDALEVLQSALVHDRPEFRSHGVPARGPRARRTRAAPTSSPTRRRSACCRCRRRGSRFC